MAQHPLASSRQRRNRMWMAWGAMAVAILTKGLIGIVMPRLVLIVYTRIAHDWALWRRLHLVSGSLLVFVIAAPWFVLVSIRGPASSSSFRTWQRHTSTVQHRAAPWWYFVPQLVAGFLPWLVLSWRIARHRRRPLQRVSPSAAAGRLGGGDLRLFQPVQLEVAWLHRAGFSSACVARSDWAELPRPGPLAPSCPRHGGAGGRRLVGAANSRKARRKHDVTSSCQRSMLS